MVDWEEDEPRCSSVELFGGSDARGSNGLRRSSTTIYQLCWCLSTNLVHSQLIILFALGQIVALGRSPPGGPLMALFLIPEGENSLW